MYKLSIGENKSGNYIDKSNIGSNKIFLPSNNYSKTSKLYIIQKKNIIYDISFNPLPNAIILNVFKDRILPYNLKRMAIIVSSDKLLFKESKNKLDNEIISFWVFKNKEKLKLYPLSVIIWPPAYKFSDEIIDYFDKKHTVVKDTHIKINKPSLVNKFVYEMYQDDTRCDKSKLKNKINSFRYYDGNFRYLKLLVEYPQTGKGGISKTSINIKKIIRERYRNMINKYVYDNIIHISDNQKHSKSMENYIKAYKK